MVEREGGWRGQEGRRSGLSKGWRPRQPGLGGSNAGGESRRLAGTCRRIPRDDPGGCDEEGGR